MSKLFVGYLLCLRVSLVFRMSLFLLLVSLLPDSYLGPLCLEEALKLIQAELLNPGNTDGLSWLYDCACFRAPASAC